MADDTNRMPLPTRDIGNLDEQPLARSVLEARLDDTKLHGTCHDQVSANIRNSAPLDVPLG